MSGSLCTTWTMNIETGLLSISVGLPHSRALQCTLHFSTLTQRRLSHGLVTLPQLMNETHPRRDHRTWTMDDVLCVAGPTAYLYLRFCSGVPGGAGYVVEPEVRIEPIIGGKCQ